MSPIAYCPLSVDNYLLVFSHPHGLIPHGFSFNGAVRAKTRDSGHPCRRRLAGLCTDRSVEAGAMWNHAVWVKTNQQALGNRQ